MRVLITTYHQAFLIRGGGEFELLSIKDSLKKAGVIADIYGPYSRSIDNYDAVLHFSVHGGGVDLLQRIKQFGKPIILWPNLWVHDKTAEISKTAKIHIDLADCIVFKSITEKDHFIKMFDPPLSKIKVMNSVVDDCFCNNAPPNLFSTLYKLKKYAIWFGVIEPIKNQIMAIRALKQFNLPLVLVGGYRDHDYYETCRKEGHENTVFIDGIPEGSEIARSALQESEFYIEIPLEPPGLSAIAAGLAGCKIVLSNSVWSKEHFGDSATYVNPNSFDSVISGVKSVLDQKPNADFIRERLINHKLPEAIYPLMDILHETVEMK